MLDTILGNGYSKEQTKIFVFASGGGGGLYWSSRKQVFFVCLFFFKAGPVIMSIEEKMEADARSIYVGNVCTRALVEVGGSSCFGELFNSLERNISRIVGGFRERREDSEEVKGNGNQQKLCWKEKRLVP